MRVRRKAIALLKLLHYQTRNRYSGISKPDSQSQRRARSKYRDNQSEHIDNSS